jgi:hypothetical protein
MQLSRSQATGVQVGVLYSAWHSALPVALPCWATHNAMHCCRSPCTMVTTSDSMHNVWPPPVHDPKKCLHCMLRLGVWGLVMPASRLTGVT